MSLQEINLFYSSCSFIHQFCNCVRKVKWLLIVTVTVLILFQIKKGGGLSFNSTLPLTKCNEKLIQLILHEYSILGYSYCVTTCPDKL